MLSGAPITAPRVIELLRKESLRSSGDAEAQVFAALTMRTWAADVFPAKSIRADEAEVIAFAMADVDGLDFMRSDLLAVLRKWIPEIAR